jgi:antitoxin component YwqK of YwqJK toxin-antitoxin module
MKQTLLTLFLLISIGLSQEYNLDELVERDGMYFEKYSDKPLRGKVYTMFGNKKVIMGKLVNGKFNGKWIYWYENVQKEYEGTFKDGKEDGLSFRWYDNGQKM